MIHPKVKAFILENRLMTLNLLIGGVLSGFLYFNYLRSHQDYYLDSFQGLVAFEALIISFYLGFKCRKTRLSETALKEKEEKLNLFTELMEEAILIREGETVVEVNDVLAKLLGYEISEMMGQNIYQFMAPQSAEENKRWIKLGYPSDRFELTAERKDGSTFPLLVHGRDIFYKGRKMRLSCGWDVSEMKKMQTTIQISEDRFKSFAVATREGILIHEKGLVVDVNQALADMLGIPPSDFIGKDSLFFVEEKSADLIRKFRIGELSALPDEITLYHSNGTPIPAETSVTTILWHGLEARAVRIWDISERKKIDKALRESQERFIRFAEVTREGILIHDNGWIVDANQALADMLGVSSSEMIGKNNRDFLAAKSYELSIQFREKGYPTIPYEMTLRRKDGTFLPAEVHGAAFNFNGKEFRVVRIWDLTERKKIEQALVESEEKFKRFAEVSREGIVIHENGVVVDMNQAGAAMLGYSPDELIGKSVMNVLDEDSQKTLLRLLREGTAAKAIEMKLVRKDKTVFFAEVTGVVLSFKGTNLRIVNFWDLTARKKAEEALRQSEVSFRNLIEKSPDAILIHGPEKIVYVNDAMLNLLGYSRADDLVGKWFTFFVHPEDTAAVQARISRLKTAGDYNAPQEKRFIRKDGEVVWVDVASFFIYFEGEAMSVAVARDLTDRKKSEEALMKFERLSTIGEMAAGMAHEIRNPLAAISVAAQILKRRKTKENSAQVETILEQSDRLDKLVQDTLDYAKSSVEKNYHYFSIKLILESALRLSQVQFGPAHEKTKVVWDLPAEDIQVNANSGRIQQVLVNLILNAYQIMGADGKLKLALKADKNSVFARVEDGGPGISDENMKRIFEPFFTTKDNGSGLGLAISQRIAQEHGGQIGVERLKPRGTAFILQIPLNGEPEK